VNKDLAEKMPLDICFQSVSGLDSTLDTETVKEGGENHFEHIIPVRRKYGPLILKRGLLTPNESRITKWLKLAFDDHFVIPFSSAQIKLLNEDNEPLMHWTINNVWPRSWKLGELNAERGEVLIETLELNYNYLIVNTD
jgi:phage tail-like protein